MKYRAAIKHWNIKQIELFWFTSIGCSTAVKVVVATSSGDCSGRNQRILQGTSSDGFVYDFYAVKNDVETMAESTANHFPLVQVDDDDDFYDGPDDSDYGTDDSNDENNPRNDYPDEESSGDEDEVESLSSNDRSEAESESSSDEQETDIYVSREREDLSRFECSYGGDPFVEDDIYSGDDCELYDSGEDVW
nr:RNA-directed DNA methylation 4 [Ipomoea batatas]